MAEKKIWQKGTLTYTTAGVVALFCWLLWGDFAWGLKQRAVGYVAGLMVKGFGINNFWYSVLMTSYPCFTNIFLMPIISYWSDRHRGRLGRRIPFLLFTTPFVMAGLFGLAVTPMLGTWLYETVGAEWLTLNLARLIVFAISWGVLDFGTTLTNAIFTALANDVVPTPLIGRFLAMFRMMSLLCAVIFNFCILGYAETHSFYIFAGLGIFYGIGLYSLCLKVKEGKYPPPEAESSRPRNVFEAAKLYFRECFALPYYRWVIAAYVCCVQSVLAVNLYAIFFAKELGMTTGEFGFMMAFVFFSAFCLSFLWGYFADKYHPIRCGMVSILALAAVQVAGGFLIHNKITFVILFMTHETTIMSFNTLMASYPQRLFPPAYFAQFNSALAMVQAISSVLLAPLFGGLLDLLDKPCLWTKESAVSFGGPLDLLNCQYSYIFPIGSILGLCGFLCLMQVYRHFLRYGGDRGYQAPLKH